MMTNILFLGSPKGDLELRSHYLCGMGHDCPMLGELVILVNKCPDVAQLFNQVQDACNAPLAEQLS